MIMACSIATRAARGPHKGFTLLELMVTILIAAILMTIAVPSFNTYRANQSVRSAAQDLVSTLNFSSREAVKRGATTAITVVPTINGAWESGWKVVGATTLKVYGSVSGVTISTPANNPSYNRDGRLTTSEISFTVASTNASVTSRCIVISASGRPTNRGC